MVLDRTAALTSELAKKDRTVGVVVFTSLSSELVILPPPSDAHSLTPTGPVDDTAWPGSVRCGLPGVRTSAGRRAQLGRHGLASKAVAPDGSPAGHRTARLEFLDVIHATYRYCACIAVLLGGTARPHCLLVGGVTCLSTCY